ncbi:MraY family glycosyltransferase [Aciduricibacillus chroicocephali]|uniref:MraY family glycosyltransferase n=1 Tax=Aciduricibacillus chroicocephali TaxID=3054939 RepID=A0ABY9KTL4_9BACI|nr:MraY family glycosyltransferase [Bacillaceae bacterium 44XB]
MIKIVLLACITLIASLIITPFIIKFALKINATDKPNARKVHRQPTPTMGGLAIFISFCIGVAILQPTSRFHWFIMGGALIMIVLGIFDDKYDLSAKFKMLVQLLTAAMIVFGGDIQLHFINLPFGGKLEFGFLGTVITILWIVGVTNAINLIDGLDGLAAGVSSIALLTIAFMSMIMGNVYVFTMAVILLFSTLGFLKFNFHPARIFMGDTGALFLGYMIAVLSLLGFKNVTIISFIIPILILGVPISDTLISMVRRYVNKQPMSKPDSAHLHHRLIGFGFTHKQTVLFIYLLSGMFSIAAILFSMATVWGAIMITLTALITVQFLIESLELINTNFKPLTNFVRVLREGTTKRV